MLESRKIIITVSVLDEQAEVLLCQNTLKQLVDRDILSARTSDGKTKWESPDHRLLAQTEKFLFVREQWKQDTGQRIEDLVVIGKNNGEEVARASSVKKVLPLSNNQILTLRGESVARLILE